MSRLSHTAQWGPLRSLLFLTPLLVLAPLYSYKTHYGQASVKFSTKVNRADDVLDSPANPRSRHVRSLPPLREPSSSLSLHRIDPVTSLPRLSEARILAHAKYLSEDIGYRTVGTVEHALGDAWMLQEAHAVREECDKIIRAHPERKLECEVWHQQGSGAHRYVSRIPASCPIPRHILGLFPGVAQLVWISTMLWLF